MASKEDLVLRESVVDTVSTGSASALQKYREIYVGRRSLLQFLGYEWRTSLLSPIPGALGFLLRKIFYPGMFAKVGKGTIIGPCVTLRCPGRISLGDGVLVDGNVVLDAKGAGSRITVGGLGLIGRNTILSCAAATITMGDNVSIGPNCYIRASQGPVELGSFVTVGSHSVVISGSPDYRRLDVPMMKQQRRAEGVTIGDDVWIGVGTRIIDGATVGDGSVIGAGAVVLNDVPEFSIAAGVPAEVIGSRQ